MSSKLPAAVDKLRRHLRGSLGDSDMQKADSLLLDVLNAWGDRSDVGGEPERERLRIGSPPGESSIARSGVDIWPNGSGLDAGIVFDRSLRSTPDVLSKVLRDTPRHANWVR